MKPRRRISINTTSNENKSYLILKKGL